jgi:hypothetical protein
VVDPLFWLGLSILLVAVSLAAVLVAALPAFRELARAARSAEKLFDTLSRELPPTLESIRLTSLEITDLKADMSEGVQGAGQVVQQIDQSISGVKKQAQQAQKTTRSVVAGFKAAWQSLKSPQPTSLRSAPAAYSSDIFDNSESSDHSGSPDSEALPPTNLSPMREATELSEKAEMDLPETPDPYLSAPPVQLPTNHLS